MRTFFAIIGGLLFAASLVFFAGCFALRFGRGEPWSAAAAWRPVIVDVLLFTAFALHHSLFARAGLKGWISRGVPESLERSVYVWIASLLFLGVCAAWRPVPGTLWSATGFPRAAMLAAQGAGVVLTLVASRRLDVLDLAGVRQATGHPISHALDAAGPYALVRHPIYLGWFLMVCFAPVMTGTRLVFAATSCAYLLAAIPFEERGLRRTFGTAYTDYERRVRWRIVPRIY